MKTIWSRRPVRLALILVAVAGLFVAWRLLLLPGVTDFAGGTPVTLEAYRGKSPAGVPARLGGSDIVTRGEYLAHAADCVACHTVKGGKPYAGGRAFVLPFGTIWTPNITPDRQTGIGAWSDAEFLKAMHEGIGRDGKRLYPAFPYASYALLSDDDVLAIRAYLATVAPVRQANRGDDFAFPFNQRWLMASWSFFYKPSGRFEPIAERSAEWNRGAYLVEAAAHCAECHSPRNLTQARDTRRSYAGGAAEGWNAYNITSDPVSGIGAWSDRQLADYLAKGHAAGRGAASGPMEEAVRLSLSKLDPSDIRAMIVYLRSVPPIRSSRSPAMARAASALPAKGPEDNSEGKRIFEGACSSCHGWSGAGQLSGTAMLTGNRAVNDPTAANVALMILHGAGRPEASGAYMPAFGKAYSDAEVAAVANYVTARFGASASRLSAADVKALREH
ncbi:MAG: cytochrome c [Sphingopyxis sp.]|nr:cytochrome c [Sphingopyxis sp.]